jgi:CheY-like chemotaxis protein
VQEYGLKCLEVGMSDVLFKPLKREALATALKKWAPGAAAETIAVVQAQAPVLAQPSSTAAPAPSTAAGCIVLPTG